MWRHFEFSGDIGILAMGSSPAMAFREAALALAAIVTPPETVRAHRLITLTVEAESLEMLFFDFMNALILTITTEGFIYSQADVTLDDHRLTARLRGEAIIRRRHVRGPEPKAVTFQALSVNKNEIGEWQCQCIIDL